MHNLHNYLLTRSKELALVAIWGGFRGLVAGGVAFFASIVSIIGLAQVLDVHLRWIGLTLVTFLFVSGPVFAAALYLMVKDKRAIIGPLLISPAPFIAVIVGFLLAVTGTVAGVIVSVVAGITVIIAALALPARTRRGKIVVGISSAMGGVAVLVPGFIFAGNGSNFASLFFFSTSAPFAVPILGLPVFGAFYGAGWELAEVIGDQD